MTRLRKLSLAIALGSATALPGCFSGVDLFGPSSGPSSGPGPGPGLDRPLVPEVHGRHVSATAPLTTITWSPSGEDVTFVSTDYRTAHAHHFQSGATRQLYASTSNTEQIYDAALSADGVDWFTTSLSGTGRVIRRHTFAGSTVLTDRGTVGLWRELEQGRGVLVAPGQPVAAFVVLPDNLFLLRRGGEPTLLGSGCSGLITFSPDESRVLCRATRGWPPTFRVFPTDGGAAESLALPTAIAEWADLIQWDAQGIRVLYWGSTHYRLYEHGTGSSRPFTPMPHDPESTSGGSVSWSRDGRKVAYWNSFCAKSKGGSSFGNGVCDVGQVLLYVLDVAAGTATRVAVHTVGPSSSVLDHQVALSPTGSMVAYTVNGGLYLLEVK